jgi:type IV pilus assembly protein PilX
MAVKIKLNTLLQVNVHQRQRGASLVVVLIILTIVSLLGVAGIQISMMSERGARNDRDQQLAWQGAEAALIDAEVDIFGLNTAAAARLTTFSPVTNSTAFVTGCGTGGTNIGLCSLVDTGKPAWLTVDFEDKSSSAHTVAYGTYTGRTFQFGSTGVQPAAKPRYIVELIPDPGERDLGLTGADVKFIFRVTAMGFGPRTDVQAVVQMLYRI